MTLRKENERSVEVPEIVDGWSELGYYGLRIMEVLRREKSALVGTPQKGKVNMIFFGHHMRKD